MERIPRFDKSNWHWHYLNGFFSADKAHPFMKEANGRYELYTKAPVYINSGEQIVGNLDWAQAAEPVVNRISMHYVERFVVESIRNDGTLSAEQKNDFEDKFQRMQPYIVYQQVKENYTEEETLAEEGGLCNSCHFNGHQVMDYGLLLEKGIDGILADIRDRKETATEEECIMLAAMERSFEGTKQFILRHAEAARLILESGEEGYGQEQLETIIRTCEAIAGGKPRTFLEGLQLHWFFMGFSDYDSFGRFDQYFLPLYEQSLKAGEPREKLKEQLTEYWRKLDQNGNILNMTIGGVKRDGSDAVNELTYLILEVTRELGLKGPNLCLRIRWDSPDALWEAAKKGIGRGNALPALYNEDLILPMLLEHGFPQEDANDFCLAGCSQVVIPGKSSFACDMGCYNALKCLELALNDGFDPVLQKQMGPHTGAASELDTFDKVLDAYRLQVKNAIRLGVSINNKDHYVRGNFLSCIRSALTSDCIARGKGLFQGGARYYAVQNEVVGLTNVANALAALRAAVFERGVYTLKQVADACRRDFEGDEEMRAYLLNKAPKFGNDDDTVDSLRVMVEKEFFTELASNKAPLGGIHWPGEVIFHYHVGLGSCVGATPDGRKAYKPMADSAGASQGTDLEGPTGILKSMLKLPFTTKQYPNTCSCLNIKFTRKLWDSAEDQIVPLFRAYFKGGGYQLQINVTNQEELLAAKKHPEDYRSLVVRVGGYNAYFVNLAESIQDDIIERHGQTVL